MQTHRQFFHDSEVIFHDVQSGLANAQERSEHADYVTFVPDGEPTLDVNLGKEIKLLKANPVPVGVITNGSLLWREDVRDELGKADWVSLKIDTVQEAVWRAINRPHRALRLPLMLDGLLAFANAFTGRLVTETMLVKGFNDNDDCMDAVAGFLHELQPSETYLSIPIRPPSEPCVQSPDEDTLNRAYQILADQVERVEYLIGYEGDDFACSGDIESDLMSITAVHPMREDAVSALLSRAGSSREVVDRLIARGDLAETKYDGHVFYLRRFAANHKAAK